MTEWPLVGRADEVAYVERVTTAGRGVVLAGEAGVGKSRLAAEILRRADEDGRPTLALSAGVASASIPFAPFAALLGEDTAGDAVDRFLRASHVIESRGDVLISIDDAHLLDEVSVAFVGHLVHATAAVLVLTVRSGEPLPAPLASLWQQGTLERIELLPLSQGEVGELVSATIAGAVDTEVVRWLWGTSEGNPLFVRELMLDAQSRGALVEREGRWVLGSPSAGTGARLREVVAGRIGALSEPERAALELLAVGESLGLVLFEELVGVDVVQTLERLALVTTTQERRRSTVRLGHPLHGEVLRGQLGASTGRARRRQLIDAVSARGAKRASDALLLAIWRCDAGDTDDWRSMLDAALALSRAYDRVLTAVWRGEREALDAPPVKSHLQVALRLARAALDASGSVEAAVEVFSLLMRLGFVADAAALDATMDAMADTEFERFQVAEMRVNAVTFGGGDVADAKAAIVAFEQTATDPVLQLAARARRVQLMAFTNTSLDEAVALASSVIADPRTASVDRFIAFGSGASALGELGRQAEAIAMLDEAIATAGSDVASEQLGLMMVMRVLVLAHGGRFEEAEQLAALGAQIAESIGGDEGIAMFSALLANINLTLGRPATALRLAIEARQRFGAAEMLGGRRNSVVVAVNAHALLGNLGEAEAGLAALDAIPRVGGVTDDDEVRARAWLDVAAGRTSIALGRLEAAAERFRAERRPARELGLLHDITRLGHAHVAVERISALAAALESEISGAIVDQTVGAARREPALLAVAAERYAALGHRLWEAEAWAQSAVLLDAEGKRSAAVDAGARSRAAAEHCEGASTPALSLGGGSDLLTRREREIAGLAARGRSDKEIADSLDVSVRTVQTHLYNAYAKLAIDGRADLAAVLGV